MNGGDSKVTGWGRQGGKQVYGPPWFGTVSGILDSRVTLLYDSKACDYNMPLSHYQISESLVCTSHMGSIQVRNGMITDCTSVDVVSDASIEPFSIMWPHLITPVSPS